MSISTRYSQGFPKRNKSYFDCSFGDYRGRTRYIVKHPKYIETIVRAPDDIAAIKAACDWWGEDWLETETYMNCSVKKVRKEKN